MKGTVVSRSDAYAEAFWLDVRAHWGTEGERFVRDLHAILKASPHMLKWGSKRSKHRSFLAIAPEFGMCKYLRVYTDGALHFYTSKLPASNPRASAFRKTLDRFAHEELAAHYDNPSHYLVFHG